MSENSHEGSVNFDQNLVKDAAQVAGAVADAVAEKPQSTIGGISLGSSPVAQVPVLSVVESTEAPVANINTLVVMPFITLSYGNPYMFGLKELKAATFNVNGQQKTFNFYNPFIKENVEKGVHEGLLRQALSRIIGIFNNVDGKEVVYIGATQNVAATANSVASQIAASVQRALHVGQDDVLFELEQVEDGSPVTIRFGDLFSIKTWTSVITDEDTCAVRTVINLNLAINAGAFYDSKDPHVFVERAMKHIRFIVEHLDTDLNPAVGVALNSLGLQDDLTRDLFKVLLDDYGFTLTTRHTVMLGKQDWISADDVDKLFVDDTDMFLFTQLFTDGEPDAQEDE